MTDRELDSLSSVELTVLREKLEAYLKYYNEDRIKLKLDGLSPVQYRLLHQAKAS